MFLFSFPYFHSHSLTGSCLVVDPTKRPSIDSIIAQLYPIADKFGENFDKPPVSDRIHVHVDITDYGNNCLYNYYMYIYIFTEGAIDYWCSVSICFWSNWIWFFWRNKCCISTSCDESPGAETVWFHERWSREFIQKYQRHIKQSHQQRTKVSDRRT